MSAPRLGDYVQEQDRLSNRALFGYGISAAPVIYAYVLILIMYMKFASVQLGISTAVIGTIFLAAKVWDAVTDPMVGFLSDRTKSRFGRRRPWILASAPLLALFSIMAWAPPEGLGDTQLIVWITVSIFGFYTAYTLFEVPHMSLGAEISIKATERNRVFGFRQALKVLGMGVAFIVGSAVIESGVGPTRTMAYILGAMTLLLIFGGVSMLPAERAEYQGRGPANPIEAVRDVFSNPHARLLLLVVFIDAIGVGGIGALTPFVVDYVVGEPQMIPALLGANMGASLLSIPVWIRLSRHFEKRRLMLYSMIGSAVGYGLIFFVGEGDWHIVLVSSLIAGFSGGCPNSLGYTLKSEIIDFDEHRTGQRKEGAYFAGWAFMSKLAAGIMIGIVGWALAIAGFDGQAEEQTELVKTTMLVLMGSLPLVCYLFGAVFFSKFSLSEADHAVIRLELDARAAETASS